MKNLFFVLFILPLMAVSLNANNRCDNFLNDLRALAQDGQTAEQRMKVAADLHSRGLGSCFSISIWNALSREEIDRLLITKGWLRQLTGSEEVEQYQLDEALLSACAANDTQRMGLFLCYGASPDAFNQAYKSPPSEYDQPHLFPYQSALSYVVQGDNIVGLNLLLRNGAKDINFENYYNECLLDIAIKHNQYDIALVLLQQGARITYKTFSLAIKLNRIEIVQLFLTTKNIGSIFLEQLQHYLEAAKSRAMRTLLKKAAFDLCRRAEGTSSRFSTRHLCEEFCQCAIDNAGA